MTVTVTAVFTPKEGAFGEVAAALSPVIAEVHEDPGCLLCAIHGAPNGQIVMIEKLESSELLDAHGAGDAVKRLDASLEDLLEEPVIVTQLSPIPAGTGHQGAL